MVMKAETQVQGNWNGHTRLCAEREAKPAQTCRSAEWDTTMQCALLTDSFVSLQLLVCAYLLRQQAHKNLPVYEHN